MKLEVNGVQYDNFTSASCELRLDALSNSFSFQAVAAEGEAFPFKGGDECKIIVNDETVLTGFIEIIEVTYNADDHIILISGRDRTSDLLDSSVSAINDLRAPITLKEIIEKVIANIGSDLEVVDDVSTESFNPAEDVASPEPGNNAFEFIEQYSRKRQVLLTSNSDGNVVITSGSAEQVDGSIQHIIGAIDNNVLSSSFSFDISRRFNSYVFKSELNPVALNNAGTTENSSIVNQSGDVTDGEIRTGRQLTIESEITSSDAENAARAQWEANVRKARSLVYSAVVTGYDVEPGADLWQINKLYQVVDDYLGKQEPMLCNSVTFTLDTSGGEQTTLGFVDQEAYSLVLTKPSTSTTADLFV
jgi:prophage tail gpP-like protein